MTVLQVWREYSGTALLFKMKHDCNIYCYHLKKKKKKERSMQTLQKYLELNTD